MNLKNPEAMSNKSKNVFISHHSADEEHISKLKSLLSKRGYNLKNSSVDSSRWNRAKNEDYIKRLLSMRINWAGTCIVLISDTTHTRDWVNWEIKKANEKGKTIVGIHCHGHAGCEVPENLKTFGDAIVNWNPDKIIDAINGQYCEFEKPDGSPGNTMWPSTSATC